MNLQPVYPDKPIFYFVCKNCEQGSNSEHGKCYADLDGEPFKAYYCGNCVGKNRSGQLVVLKRLDGRK